MRIVLTGASGQLGAYLVAALATTPHELVLWSGSQKGTRAGRALVRVDLNDAAALRNALEKTRPDAIVHAAAISKPTSVFEQRERAWRVNVEATRGIADWCATNDRALVFTSTDLVFDGARGWYDENDTPRPLNAYARTKVAAEGHALSVPRGLVARMALMYGPSRNGQATYFDDALAALKRGQPQRFFVDEFRTPLDYQTAAHALVALLHAGARGVVHVAGRQRLSRFDLMSRIARRLDLNPALVQGDSLHDHAWSEPRAPDCSLKTNRLSELLPDLSRPPVEDVVRTWT